MPQAHAGMMWYHVPDFRCFPLRSVTRLAPVHAQNLCKIREFAREYVVSNLVCLTAPGALIHMNTFWSHNTERVISSWAVWFREPGNVSA